MKKGIALFGFAVALVAVSIGILMKPNIPSETNIFITQNGILDNIADWLNHILSSSLKSAFVLWASTKLSTTNGTLVVDGIHSPIQIVRGLIDSFFFDRSDEYGVPHIYAKNKEDMYFGQGFVHAQDRLWQMDINRRSSTGKLCEIFGSATLPVDRVARNMGFDHVNRIDQPSGQDVVTATSYAKGVNAYLESEWFVLPVEYTILGIKKVEPWTIYDSWAFARSMAWQMQKGWAHEITRNILYNDLPVEAAAELEPHFDPDIPAHMPRGIEVGVHYFDESIEMMQYGGGSNGWAVSGNKTKSGKPILSNDVHLALLSPSVWYEVHLVSEEDKINVIGASIPGLENVVIGHNERVAWGVTLSNIDVEDLFLEKFTEWPTTYEHKGKQLKAHVRDEVIHIKGQPDHIEQVVETIHGPIVSHSLFETHNDQHIALSSIAVKSKLSTHGIAEMATATCWNDFVKAVEKVQTPTLNVVYADVHGNIGYYVTGAIPVRDNKGTGVTISNGWTGEHDWIGRIPFSEMPHILNPKEGFVLSANHPIASENYNHYLGRTFSQAFRAQRLHNLLSNHSKEYFTVEDFVKFQNDVYSLPAKKLASKIIHLYEKMPAEYQQDEDMKYVVNALKNWDGKMTKETIEGSIYQVVRNCTLYRILAPTLSAEKVLLLQGKGFHPVFRAASEFIGFDISTLLRLLRSNNSWWVTQRGGAEKVVYEGVKDAMQLLENHFGPDRSTWQWGKLHQISFKHILGSQPPLDRVFNIGPFPHIGDLDTAHLSGHVPGSYIGSGFNPTYKHIIELADLKTVSVHAPGQSGQLGSRHYSDMLPLWLSEKLHPSHFRKTPSEVTSEGTIVLQPALGANK